MRLTQLNISDYKNLNVDLQNSNAGIVAFIGNNGSGKSNILEALSIIFSHLFQKKEKDIPFNFSISYEIGSARNKVSIQKQKTSVTTSIDGEKKSDPYNYLPKQIIAIYSGEEDRLWRKCYRPLYMEYIRDITSAHNSKLGIYNELPRMLYVNKFYWHISLLCLLLNRKYNPNDEFCKNILGIKNVNSVKFIFNKSNYSGYAESLVKQFIQEIDHKDEYSLEDFQKLVDGKGYNLIDVYKYLYIAFTPDKKKMLENIIIKYNDENLEVEDFSEGEKKMLLIKAALEFAGLEDSLFVLDEPDAHIHLSNKVEIKKVFNHYSDNRQVIITTHSPTLTDTLEEESLIMMNSGKLVPHKKQEILENVSGDFWNKFQQNAFIASKSPIILLVEGKHDKEHIQNAYNILKDEYSDLKFDIFHMNSACNIPPMMLGLRTNEYKHNKIIIGLFDDDETGRAECDKTACYFPNEQNQKRHVENYFSLKYPKYEGYKSKDFTVENFFGAQIVNDAYTSIMAEINELNKEKSIDSLSEDIKEKVKSIIFQKSSELTDKEDFKHFRKLFDLIRKIKEYSEAPNAITTKKDGKTEIKDLKDDQKNEIKKQGKMIDFVEVSTDKRNTEINAEYYNERKIVLKTGSKLSKEVVSTYKQKAARNRELKKIATETDEHWVLKEDKAFSSVSGAINYATGGSMNGWEYWIITESGAALQSIRK